jgi:hypothetical protein
MRISWFWWCMPENLPCPFRESYWSVRRQVSEPELWSYCLASCSLQTASCLNAHIVMLTVEHKLGLDAGIIPVLVKKKKKVFRFRWRSRQDNRKEQVCFLLMWNCTSGVMQNVERASQIVTAVATCIQMAIIVIFLYIHPLQCNKYLRHFITVLF